MITEQLILRSFDNGMNTADIAKKLKEKESEIDYLLHQALNKRRQEKSNG